MQGRGCRNQIHLQDATVSELFDCETLNLRKGTLHDSDSLGRMAAMSGGLRWQLNQTMLRVKDPEKSIAVSVFDRTRDTQSLVLCAI
jgi:hypothetical protein